MTLEEIQRNNTLIAKFMGLRLRPSYGNENYPHIKFWYSPSQVCVGKEDGLGYHWDWNRLMQVVEKIWGELHHKFKIEGSGCNWGGWCHAKFSKEHCLSEGHKGEVSSNPHLELDTQLIDEVYKGVVRFIEYYNEEKRK
jgi:hypothetical protein